MTEMLPGDPAIRLYPCKDPRYLHCRRPAGQRCVDSKGNPTQPHGFRFAQGQAYADAYNLLHPQLTEAASKLTRAVAANTDLQTKVTQAAEDLVTVRQQLEAETRAHAEDTAALKAALERIDDLEHPDPDVPVPLPTPDPDTTVRLPFGIGINDEPDNGPTGAAKGATLAQLEADAGVPFAYAHGYFEFEATAGPDAAMIAFAKRHLTAGRIPLITAKVPGDDWVSARAGKFDAAVHPTIEGYAELVDEYGGQVVQGIHHEPMDNGTRGDWLAMQDHYLPIVQTPGAVQMWANLEGWAQFLDPAEKTWTIDQLKVDGLDGYLFDPYLAFWQLPKNSTKLTDMVKTYLTPMSAWCAEHDYQWGIGETGMTEVAAAKSNAGIPTWWRDFTDGARRLGAGPVTYWNRYNPKSKNDWRLTATMPANKRAQMVAAMRAARA